MHTSSISNFVEIEMIYSLYALTWHALLVCCCCISCVDEIVWGMLTVKPSADVPESTVNNLWDALASGLARR
jgi:hypothetical protein